MEISSLKRLYKHSCSCWLANNRLLLLASNWHKNSEIYFKSYKEILTLRLDVLK